MMRQIIGPLFLAVRQLITELMRQFTACTCTYWEHFFLVVRQLAIIELENTLRQLNIGSEYYVVGNSTNIHCKQ